MTFFEKQCCTVDDYVTPLQHSIPPTWRRSVWWTDSGGLWCGLYRCRGLINVDDRLIGFSSCACKSTSDVQSARPRHSDVLKPGRSITSFGVIQVIVIIASCQPKTTFVAVVSSWMNAWRFLSGKLWVNELVSGAFMMYTRKNDIDHGN